MASNLPPGVTENIIPGNRPGDAADEALAERIWDTLEPLRSLIISRYEVSNPLFGLTDEDERIQEGVEMALFALVSEAYSKGYQDSRDDEHMERQARALDKEPM